MPQPPIYEKLRSFAFVASAALSGLWIAPVMAETPPKWQVEIRADELTDEKIVTAYMIQVEHNTSVTSLVVVCKKGELITGLRTGQLWSTTGEDVQLRFDKGEILYMRWAFAPGPQTLFSQDRRLFNGLTTARKLVARVVPKFDSPTTVDLNVQGFRSVAGVLLDYCPRGRLTVD